MGHRRLENERLRGNISREIFEMVVTSRLTCDMEARRKTVRMAAITEGIQYNQKGKE